MWYGAYRVRREVPSTWRGIEYVVRYRVRGTVPSTWYGTGYVLRYRVRTTVPRTYYGTEYVLRCRIRGTVPFRGTVPSTWYGTEYGSLSRQLAESWYWYMQHTGHTVSQVTGDAVGAKTQNDTPTTVTGNQTAVTVTPTTPSRHHNTPPKIKKRGHSPSICGRPDGKRLIPQGHPVQTLAGDGSDSRADVLAEAVPL